MNCLKYVSLASISKKHIQLSLHLLYNKHSHNSRQLQYYYAHRLICFQGIPLHVELRLEKPTFKKFVKNSNVLDFYKKNS